MNKFAKALILSLVIAAPVAISLPMTEAEAAVATETNAAPVVSHAANYEVAYYHRRPVRHRVVRRRIVRHNRRYMRRHN